jgi:serine/threonine-protein kinase
MAPVPGGVPLAGGALGNLGPPTGLRPSQVETALSLPRPDANALWAAQQVALRNTEKKSTAVLVAVAVLTAICVIVLGFLYYYRFVNPDPASQVVPRGPERATMSARDTHDSRA